MGSLLSEVLSFNADGSISQSSGSNSFKNTTVSQLTSTGNINQTGLTSTSNLGDTTVSKLTSTGDITQSFGSTVLKNLNSDNLTTGSISSGSITQHTTTIAQNLLQNTFIDKIYSSYIYPSSGCDFQNNPFAKTNIINIGKDDGTTQIILNGPITYTSSTYNQNIGTYMNQFTY